MTTIIMTEHNGNPILVIKEKVEKVKWYNATQVQIFFDSGDSARVMGTIAGIKDILDGA